jgi:endonuclease I
VWQFFLNDYVGEDGCAPNLIKGCYSDICWDRSKQCGSYKKEGDCYNREHSYPKSWFGGFSAGKGAQTDLFHMYPADGYDNNVRASYPLGEVSNPTYTSNANAKLGPCTVPGFTDTCWEPPADFKGRFARSYFYISTTYMGQFKCCDTAGITNGSDIKPWMLAVLLQWNQQYPIEQDEIEMNESIFQKYQKNRNPYIDFPFMAELVFGETVQKFYASLGKL